VPETPDCHVDVVVAGAGPVGLSAALALGRAGRSVVVVTDGSGLSAESRASTFHPPTLEILDELGLADAALERGLVAPVFQFRDRGGGVVASFDMSELADVTKYPYRLQLQQSRYTPLVVEALRALANVRMIFDAPVGGVTQDPDGVTVTAGAHTVRASWMIGADGAHSAVRRILGVPFEGMTYEDRYLVASTTHDFRASFPDLAHVNYIADPREYLVLLNTPQAWRALFPIRDGETDEEASEPSRVQARLQGIAPVDGGYEVLHTTLYKVHQRVAATYRSGRVMLAGDAAHINNPLGGMGMNSGVHDAWFFVKTLLRQWDGTAAPDELDRVAAWRKSVSVDHVKATTHGNYARLSATDPVERTAYRDDMIATAADPVRRRAYLLRTSLLESARHYDSLVGTTYA
jgi:2-polyprenyl-6-methoxyphenol hydroxylase-like FAD-dependent oxidoreductase